MLRVLGSQYFICSSFVWVSKVFYNRTKSAGKGKEPLNYFCRYFSTACVVSNGPDIRRPYKNSGHRDRPLHRRPPPQVRAQRAPTTVCRRIATTHCGGKAAEELPKGDTEQGRIRRSGQLGPRTIISAIPDISEPSKDTTPPRLLLDHKMEPQPM